MTLAAAAPPHPVLAEIEALLVRHAEAVRLGRAHDLQPLAERLRERVAAYSRNPDRTGAAQATVLPRLLRQCQQTQAMLARREQDVDASLRTLCAGAPRSEDMGQRFYGARGALAGTAWRSRGFGQA